MSEIQHEESGSELWRLGPKSKQLTSCEENILPQEKGHSTLSNKRKSHLNISHYQNEIIEGKWLPPLLHSLHVLPVTVISGALSFLGHGVLFCTWTKGYVTLEFPPVSTFSSNSCFNSGSSIRSNTCCNALQSES